VIAAVLVLLAREHASTGNGRREQEEGLADLRVLAHGRVDVVGGFAHELLDGLADLSGAGLDGDGDFGHVGPGSHLPWADLTAGWWAAAAVRQ